MRILAIRGCNLASLAGEFEIDLASAPLGGAGVFAIVGNTGAGKSTLLDALCVALFDRTPRLTNHSRVVVGRGEDDPGALGAQDARTLLRRGASAGWAEVDFESGDARRYRARWSVRRARNQTDGTLQDQQITLTAIDGGERLGGTKTETLKAISARLGLTFDQFRRSALLAQGEFAAFLRADGKDRSELLERMTGTEIYSRLSIAAHEKATLAELRLRDGRTIALAIATLDDDARRTAEQDLVLAEEAKTAARATLAAAELAVRWLAEDEARRLALVAAEASHRAAAGAVDAAELQRGELALRRRAELLRGPWDEASRLDRQLALARRDVHVAAEAAARTIATATAIAERRTMLGELHAPIRAGRIAAGLVERSAPIRIELAAAQAARADAAWLVEREHLAPEVAGWNELDTRFAQQAALGDAIAGIDRELAGHDATRTALAATRKSAAAEHQTAVAKLGEAQRKAATYQQRRGLTLDAARRQEEQARTRLVDIERLVAIASGARQATTARDALDRQLAELDQAHATDLATRTELESARALAATVRTERTRVVDELRRAAGYEHARAELRTGEACPLCGATEHPWRDRGAFDDVIAAAEAKLAAVVSELDGFTAQLATLTARGTQRDRERVRLASHRATALASATNAVSDWRDHLATLGELMLVDDPATPAAEQLASDREATGLEALEQARDVRRQTEAATKAAAEAQAEVQLVQSHVDQLAARLADIGRQLTDLEASVERLRGSRAERAARQRELAGSLVEATARWVAALPVHDRARFFDFLPHPVAALSATSLAEGGAAQPPGRRARNRTGKPSSVASGAATPFYEAAAASSTLVVDDTSARDARATSAPAAMATAAPDVTSLDAIALDRGRVALGELAAAWRARSERVCEADAMLAAALAEIDREAREAERAVAEHAARLGESERRRDNLAIELREAATRLADARASSGFDDETLRALLAADASRIDELVAQLAELERAVERAQAVVSERRRFVAEHAAQRPASLRAPIAPTAPTAPTASTASTASIASTAPTAPITTADLEALARAVTEADEHAARLTATLAADADARQRRDAALAALASSELEAEVDRVLGAVIGSHDGKLFRSFAQSLTLDGLLAVANSHLEELAPRYQLERVPRHDLELQVIDRDLGAEVRSVQSLSGGESFLVSLALALGLSSMSAHDVRVRTLLIDEGFGTLDPATLDSALSVLDALQATGRQVGVISHVPALVERVGAHVRVIQRGGGRSEVIVA